MMPMSRGPWHAGGVRWGVRTGTWPRAPGLAGHPRGGCSVAASARFSQDGDPGSARTRVRWRERPCPVHARCPARSLDGRHGGPGERSGTRVHLGSPHRTAAGTPRRAGNPAPRRSADRPTDPVPLRASRRPASRVAGGPGAAGAARPAREPPGPWRGRSGPRAPDRLRRPHHRPPVQHDGRRRGAAVRRRGRAPHPGERRPAAGVRPVAVPSRRQDGVGPGRPGPSAGAAAYRAEPRLAGLRAGPRQDVRAARDGRAGPAGHARPAPAQRRGGGGLESRLDVLLAARLQLRRRSAGTHRP